jgi:hypothetical protein
VDFPRKIHQKITSSIQDTTVVVFHMTHLQPITCRRSGQAGHDCLVHAHLKKVESWFQNVNQSDLSDFPYRANSDAVDWRSGKTLLEISLDLS